MSSLFARLPEGVWEEAQGRGAGWAERGPGCSGLGSALSSQARGARRWREGRRAPDAAPGEQGRLEEEGPEVRLRMQSGRTEGELGG